MKIVFVHFGIEFDGNSLRERPLGGTETALIGVSKELAKIAGNEVFIFTNTPTEAVFDGVNYFPIRHLMMWAATNDIDIFISIRQWLVFWLPFKARVRIYFSPDAHDQPFLKRAFDLAVTVKGESIPVPFFSPSYFFNDIDAIFCVGKWQAQSFVQKLGFPSDKIYPSGNGVFLENFSPLSISERRPDIMYSATPFRGLDHLIGYFPAIKKQCPRAGLEVCSGMGVYGISREQETSEYGSLYKALAAIGATSHGSIKQSELAKIMCRNRVYAYPNTFEETFCISVLEAQAAGLAVVTSKKGALPERITHGLDGFLVAGEPHQENYIREFIAITTKLLTDDNLWTKISQNAIKRASTQTYQSLANQWMTQFTEMLARKKIPTLGIIPQLKPIQIDLNRTDKLKLAFDTATLVHFVKQAFHSLGLL